MTKTEEDQFWSKQRPDSRIKAALVSDYFPKYCRIVDRGKGEKFIYVDFWAGRGKYGDGQLSTPLLLADIISKDPNLKNKVQFAFNDLNNIDYLKNNWEERYPKGTFSEVRFAKEDAEKSEVLKRYLNKPLDPKKTNNPKLLFFDPYGYAGIDTKSLANFILPWGNELFLFLNVNRVLAALTNPKMVEHIALMFPKFKVEVIAAVTAEKKDEKRVSLLLGYLAKEFENVIGPKLNHCAFKFMEHDVHKTSHLIIHFCKHISGFKLVKQVFYDYDNIGAILQQDGTFTFDAKKAYHNGIIDFKIDDNVHNLSKSLTVKFSRRELTVPEIINEDHPSKYAPTHYVEALRQLEEEAKIRATFKDNSSHRKSVLNLPSCLIKFL